MTIEVANIILNAKDDMSGIEIALVAIIRGLQKRDRDHSGSAKACGGGLRRNPPSRMAWWVCSPPRERRTKWYRGTKKGTRVEHQIVTLARDKGGLKGSEKREDL